MHTIDDGLVKGELVEALQNCDGRAVAFTASTLLNRGKQVMVVDACLEVANRVHPRYTVAILQIFQAKTRTTEDLARLIATCVIGVREAGGSVTPLVPRISKVITGIVSRAQALDMEMDVAMLKRLPLTIGKKWAPVAANCLRTVAEGIPQADAVDNRKLARLFKDECSKGGGMKKEERVDGEIELDVKMGAIWTFVRCEPVTSSKYEAPLITDPECYKVIRSLRAEQPEERVTCHRS